VKCMFCGPESEEIKHWDSDLVTVVHHLVVTIDTNGNTHVHGPVDKPDVMRMLIKAAEESLMPETKGRA